MTHAASDAPAAGHALRRQLGRRDLVLMQVLLVYGVTWAGLAARQGSAHMVFWLAGILLLLLPVAGVVQYCSRIWPLEGGVYQWTRHALGPLPGFLAAWNFGLWALLVVASLGLITATSLSYALGPPAAWMAESTWFIAVLNLLIFGLILLVNVRGLGIGRWVGHFGTAVTLLVVALVVVLLVVHPAARQGHPPVGAQPPFALAWPALTALSLNLFAKLTFNGLTGLEQVAVFAGETRDPARSILSSAWIAAPLVALMYILTTGALLTYTPAARIDLNGPIPQLLAAAFGGSAPAAAWLGRTTILLLAIAAVAQYAVIIAETARLPLVAAWDQLLPRAFMQLHPRYRTPTRSLAVVVGLALAVALLSSADAGAQEAFQAIVTSANVCYCINYLFMFAVPLAAGARFGAAPGRVLRAGCLCGAAVTLLALVFSFFPVVAVADPRRYALKVAAFPLALNALALLIYWRARRRAAAARTP
ncbi:MAG: APC family permease [Gammaproteobacteria bacterium]|nr:APC family permease [Gammaproteobacteria bacterium]